MKILLFFLLAAGSFSQTECNREKKAGNCFKGKLAVKGMCANYTIALLEGGLDASKTQASWTDENTGKTYKTVFALANPCSFPETIEEGQEFYFTLEESKEDCMVCQAFYPKPAKALAIKVLEKSCR